MKKKLLYVILSFVFSFALIGTGAAVVTTDAASQAVMQEGESVSVSQTADEYGVTYTSNKITRTVTSGRAVYTAAYSGAAQTITLPAGEYLLEAYGGSGGGATPSTLGGGTNGNNANATYQGYVTTYKGNTSWQTVGSRGGAGGYARGVMKLTSATTLNLYVGGAGVYGTGRAVAVGGWNGGAAGSTSANGGGGGASDIRIGGNTVYYRVLVAGGGGGADNAGGNRGTSAEGGSDDGSGGAGGGATAERYHVDGAYGGSAATQTSGYNFGSGQSPTANTDTGGGGGGWYGGYASNHNNGGAGGGSGYVLTSSSARPSGYAHNTSSPYNMTGTANICGIWSGAGKIVITMNDAPPVTKNYTVPSVERGTASAAIAPTTIASDSDSYSTLYWADTNKIYTDAACTSVVSSDILTVSGMTAAQAGSFTITPKRWIAAGTTYYAKVRDNYGGGATTGLIGNIAFKFGTSDNALTQRAYTMYSNYRVGLSTTTDVTKITEPNQVYNPNGTNRYTVVIPMPVDDATPVTIAAQDLFTDRDKDRNYDTILITSITNASASAYTVTANDYQLSRGYASVRITHNSASAGSAGYLGSVSLRVQSAETATGTLMGAAQTVEVVFKVENTRPKLFTDIASHKSGGDYDGAIGMKAGDTLKINLEDFSYDNDRNRNEIKEVKVPANEFIALDRRGEKVSFRPGVNNNYNITSNNPVTGAGMADSVYTAEGTKALKFEKGGIVDAASSASILSTAYLSYTIDPDGQFISITALRATRYQYSEAGRLGDFYFMVRIEDKGDTNDTGIWFPIAVSVTNTTPTQASSVAIADSSTHEGNVKYFSPMGIGMLDPDKVNDPDYNADDNQIQGVAEDRDSFSYFVDGSYAPALANRKAFKMYNEFLVFDVKAMGLDSDEKEITTPFYKMKRKALYAPMATVAKLAAGWKNASGLGPFVNPSQLENDMSWMRYDEWQTSDTENIWLADAANKVIGFWGLEITYLRSTNGNYVQQPVVVKDLRGAATKKENDGDLNGLVNILVKVADHDVSALGKEGIESTNDKIKAHYYNNNAETVSKTAYAQVGASLSSSATVYYTVPREFSFEISPYDIASDVDLIDGWVPGTNTNPNRTYDASNNNTLVYDAAYASQLEASKEPYQCFFTTNPLNLSTTKSGLSLNRLTFSGSPQVTNTTVGNAEVDATGEFVTVTTTTRTSSANPLAFTVKITDGETGEISVRIFVNIINNVPQLKESANKVFYLSSNYLGLNAETTNSSNDYSSDSYIPAEAGRDMYTYAYNVREFTPSDLATDFDDVSLYFQSITVNYYTLGADGQLKSFDGGANYVDAMFTQASGGRGGQVLRITAKQSTQKLAGGLFLGVMITDSYGFTTSLNTNEIKFQIEVVNSEPVVNKDVETGFVVEQDASGDQTSYSWNISPKSSNDVATERYIVSNSNLYNFLTDKQKNPTGTLLADNVRLLSSDSDVGQGLMLYAGSDNETFHDGNPNIPLYAYAMETTRGELVPYGGGSNNDVAVLFTSPSDTRAKPITLIEIIYFETANGGSTFTKLDSPYNHDDEAFTASTALQDAAAAKYVDNPYWAIKIKSNESFSKPVKMTLRVRDTVDTSRDTEKAYDGKRVLTDGAFVKNAEVDGAASFDLKIMLGAAGMRITHSYYNVAQPDGTVNTGYFLYNESDVNESDPIPYGTFNYNGINIQGGNDVALEVPLSYFAFPDDLPRETARPKTQAVSFNGAFVKSTPSSYNDEVYKHISLSDGVNTWSGATLNDNPFFTIDVSYYPEVPKTILGQRPHSDYYNTVLRKYYDYLPDEEDIDKTDGTRIISETLYENRQTLRFKRKGPRNGITPLKLTLDLGLYSNYNDAVPTLFKNGDTYITASVTVDVTLSNSTISVPANSGYSNDTVNKLGLSFDTGNEIPRSDAETTAYTFRLYNPDIDEVMSKVINMAYTDANILRSVSNNTDPYKLRYRDTARFLYSSLGVKGSSAPVLTKAQLSHMVSSSALINTANTSNDHIAALAGYLGITANDPQSQLTAINALTENDLAALDPNKANDPYGYNYYFDIDAGSNSDTFTIRIKNKTSINTAGLSPEEIKTKAAEKNLVAENVGNNDWKFYFPLKVIVYDTYNGSTLENGSWMLVTIKVRISNTVPSVNSSLLGKDGTMNISITVEQSDSYTLNLVDVISDTDCVLSPDGSHYLTATELSDGGHDLNVKDHLVYDTNYNPEVLNSSAGGLTGYTNYYMNGETPVRLQDDERRVIVTEEDPDEKPGRITFSAAAKTVKDKSVIGTETYVAFRIADSRGAYTNLLVKVTITDKAPETLKKRENADGTGAKLASGLYPSDLTQLTMKTGDFFDVIVTPYDFWLDDQSLSATTLNDQTQGKVFSTYTYDYLTDESGAPKLIKNSTAMEQGKHLGVYAMADDDTAKSLSLNCYAVGTYLTVTPLVFYSPRGTLTTLLYRITANSVHENIPLTCTVTDATRAKLTVNFSITVVSTPPSVIPPNENAHPGGLDRVTDVSEAGPEGVTADDVKGGYVFTLNMKVGDAPKTLRVTDLAVDPDRGDSSNMYLYRAFSGSCFEINGTAGATSAFIELTTENQDKAFTITPLNFKDGNEFEQIVFYIMDPYGQSLADAQKIIINVYIAPNELKNEANTGANTTYIEFSVKSKTAFAADSLPSNLAVITNEPPSARSARGLVYDPDFGSSRTSYEMNVYAMLRSATGEDGKTTWNTLTAADFLAQNEVSNETGVTPFLLKSYTWDFDANAMLTASAEEKNTALYRYVTSFFEFSFGSDGSNINFTPVNSTLGVRIPIYVEVVKRGITGVSDMSKYSSSAYFSVGVANSAPTATVASSANATAFAGDGNFLYFVGKVGDSRGYTVQNKEEPFLGLFSDPDSNDTVSYNSRAVSGSGFEVKEHDFGTIGGEEIGLVTVPDGWRANAQQGISTDAISVTHTGGVVTIRFNRKVDAAMRDGKEFVRIPLVIYGVDSQNAPVETYILLEVRNAEPTVKEITSEDNFQQGNDKGYTLTRSLNDDGLYLDVKVERDSKKIINLADFYTDPDSTGGDRSNCDIISYAEIAGETRSLSDIDRDTSKKHIVYSNSSPDKPLFEIRTRISTSQSTGRVSNTGLEITGLTYDRGEVGYAIVDLADSAGTKAERITIRITVANTRPYVKDASKLQIDILGSDSGGMNGNLAKVNFNILDYVSDYNVSDATRYESITAGLRPNYLRISSMSLGDTSTPTGGNVLDHPTPKPGDETDYSNVFSVGQMFEDEDDYNPQVFFITPREGVYGWQQLTITVVDDGNNIDSSDALEFTFSLTVYVARDPSTLTANVIEVARGRERTVTISQILDKTVTTSAGTEEMEYSGGYTLNSISLKDPNNSRAIALTNDMHDDRVTPRFRIKATAQAKESTEYIVVAHCSIGGSTDADIEFPVFITENRKPWLNGDYDGITKNFYASDEENGLVYLTPVDVFNDDYPGVGSVLVFEGVTSNMSSVCEVNLDSGNNRITLNFKANREVELTIKVHDETGETVTEVIRVKAPEKPDLGFFSAAMIYVASNPLLFAIIFGGLLLFILILIIIILAVRKKRRMRKEIEALLVSEMEMEEQMLKLSAGAQNPYFNSFGYLPPSAGVPSNAPLLGGGISSQGAAPSNAIGLNPGEGAGGGTNAGGPGGGFNGDNF